MASTLLAALVMAASAASAAPAALAEQTAQAASVSGVANAARLQLRWEMQRKPATEQLPQGGSPARFVLTNGDTQALPAGGWTLYFTGIDRMPNGAQSAGLVPGYACARYFSHCPALPSRAPASRSAPVR